MSSETKLTRDEDGESVDNTKYHGMNSSLLYLIASLSDIMFSVCLCANFQEDPKSSHLEAVKRISRYIKGTTHLGLWYPKGTGVETIVYADSDHARDYVDHKSTSGVCTFMGYCLTHILIIKMPKSSNDKKENKLLRRMAKISVRACCLINPPSNSPTFQHFSPLSDYQTTPPSTPLDSPPTTPLAPPSFSPSEFLTTPKTTPPPLTTPPPAPTQPSKQSSPLTINLEPVELISSTPPTSPHPFFDSVKDLSPRTANPPPPQPTFDFIERLVS
ncbi:hypothetical protein Tco_1300519 [Tanacetum coccineum]